MLPRSFSKGHRGLARRREAPRLYLRNPRNLKCIVSINAPQLTGLRGVSVLLSPCLSLGKGRRRLQLTFLTACGQTWRWREGSSSRSATTWGRRRKTNVWGLNRLTRGPKAGPGPSCSPRRVSFCCLTDDDVAWCGRAAPGLCGDRYWLMAAKRCRAVVVPRCCGSVEQLLGGSAWCLMAIPVTVF